MGWFTRLCRNTGLMIHHIAKPEGGQKHVVSERREEKKVNGNVTLRRTTIEEIEVRPTKEDET